MIRLIKTLRCITLRVLAVPARLWRTPRLSVLLYHAVAEDGWFYAVTPSEFKRQMAYIAEHFNTVSLAEVEAYMQGKPLVRDTVAVTFDDGYEDFIDEALPVLQSHSIPVTLFASLPSTLRDELGTTRPLVSESPRTLPRVVEIGSHGSTHRKLSKLSATEITKELAESRKDIESHFGRAPRYLAYPKGSYSPQVMELAEGVGFKAAFTTLPRAVSLDDNVYALPRIQVDASTSFGEFKARLTKAADWYCAVRQLL